MAVAAIEAIMPNIQNDEQKEFTQYVVWAKQKADWLNPLVGRVDEVLVSCTVNMGLVGSFNNKSLSKQNIYIFIGSDFSI